jgi:toxin ParE1/3/4
MKSVYSRQARADLDRISAYYTASASPVIAAAIGRRLEDVIDRICRVP